MTDFERFVDGHGRMAALLRALPPFEAPAGMEARFIAALPAAPAADGSFDAPASLTASVLAEAARIDAAQATRREAALRELERGAAEALLGIAPGEGTAAWLRQQAAATRAAKARPRPRRAAWFPALGGAVAAGLALGVALQILRETPSDPPAPADRRAPQDLSVPSSAPQEAKIAVSPSESAVPPSPEPVPVPVPVPVPAARERQAAPSPGRKDGATRKAESPMRAARPEALHAPASPRPAMPAAPAATMRLEKRGSAPAAAASGALAEPPAAQIPLRVPAASEALAESRGQAARAIADRDAAPGTRLRVALDAPASEVAGELLATREKGVRWRAQANVGDAHEAALLIGELRQRGVSIELDFAEVPPGELIVERRP